MTNLTDDDLSLGFTDVSDEALTDIHGGSGVCALFAGAVFLGSLDWDLAVSAYELCAK